MRKKVVLLMIVAAALMALPALAQNYGNPYKPALNRNGVQQVEATVPASSFQSTSTLTGSGSTYSANPTLNSDGTASYGASKGGPLRAKMDGDDDDEEEEGGGMVIDTPPGGGDDKIPSPLGDAVLPLLLCAFAFCGYLYLRRRRSEA